MLKITRTNKAAENGKIPKGVQFLSPRHITNAKGHLAKITKMTTDKPDNYGNPYVVYFVMDGDKYSKGLKGDSLLLIDLVDILGTEDEKKMIGKEILIGKTVDDEGGERLTFAAKK